MFPYNKMCQIEHPYKVVLWFPFQITNYATMSSGFQKFNLLTGQLNDSNF